MWYVLRERRYSSAKLQKFTDVCMVGWGDKFVPSLHHTNNCKVSGLWGAISSFRVFNKSLSNYAVLLILRCSLQCCRRIFSNLSMSKVEENHEGSVGTTLDRRVGVHDFDQYQWPLNNWEMKEFPFPYPLFSTVCPPPAPPPKKMA